jgi:DNA-directed RNA polymerase sigma subunit (sigma70/sigma32)
VINKTKPKEKSTVTYIPLVQQALEALQSLNPVERAVLGLRFGLDDGLERDLQDVASHYGVSPEIIKGVEIDALHKLRHHSCYQNKSKRPKPRAARDSASPRLYLVEK